jgi:hypothetical protein
MPRNYNQNPGACPGSINSNPARCHSRYNLYNDFKTHLESFPNVELHTVELTYGDRTHCVTDPLSLNHIQLRTLDQLARAAIPPC